MRGPKHLVQVVLLIAATYCSAHYLLRQIAGSPRDPEVIELARKGMSTDVIRVIRSGAPVDSRSENGDSLLFVVLTLDNYELATSLIDLGADINAENEYGHTILDWSCDVGNDKLVQWVSKHGGKHGSRPLLPR